MAIALEAHPLMAAEDLSAAAAAERLRAARAATVSQSRTRLGLHRSQQHAFFRVGRRTLWAQWGRCHSIGSARIEQAALQFGALGIVPLYTSGQISRSIGAASAQLDAAELQVRIASMNLKLNVAAAYVIVIRAEWTLAVAQATFERP